MDVGDWYALEYEGKIYPGEVQSVTADDVQVSVMVRAGKYWQLLMLSSTNKIRLLKC